MSISGGEDVKVKIGKDVLVKLIRSDIDVAENYYQENIKERVEENIKLYKCDEDYYKEIMPNASKKSRFISSDIADTVEAVLAQLMKIFFGSDDVISISGRNAEDVENAKVLQDLINYQITRENNGFIEFYRWFKDALYKDFGVMKVTWERQFKTQTMTEILAYEQFEALNRDPNIEIKSFEPVVENPEADGLSMLYKVKYVTKQLKINRPVFECVPYYEFLFCPDARVQDKMLYAIHKKKVTADYLRRRGELGIYKNVEEAIEKGDMNEGELDNNIEVYNKTGGFFVDNTYADNDARKTVVIYEYWGKIDINNDGKLEDVICTISGDVILNIQENTLGEIPFAILSPVIETDGLVGKGFSSMIKQIQNFKTLLIKEFAYNIALSNDARLIINTEAVNLNDYISGMKTIRAKGNIPLQEVVMPLPFEPIHNATFSAIEYFDTIKENRTGITRYNQGLDARSLNKTATGVNLIMQASNQKLELIARVFAETGIRRLFKLLVGYNLRFIEGSQVERICGKALNVTDDDFDGKFDYIVNAGVGISSKQETIQNLNMLLNIQSNLLTKIGLANPANIYNTVYKLVELMGFKNVNDYLAQPQQQPQQPLIQQPQPPMGAPQEQAGGQEQMSPEAMQVLMQQIMAGGGNT